MKPGDASFYGKDGNLDAAIARYNIHPAKSEFYVRTRAVFLKKIREVAKEGDFVFDMGCSFGYNTCEIAEIYKQLGLNATIVGFDLKSQQIKNAKELAKRKGLDNVKFRVFDALAIEHLIKDYEPTLITSLYSFHHIPDGKEDIHSNKIKVLNFTRTMH